MNLDKLFFRKLPIRRKLLILIYGAVIPAATIFGGLSLYLSSDAFLRLAGERFQRDVSVIAIGLQQILGDIEKDLKYLSVLPSYRALVKQGSEADLAARTRAEEAFALLVGHRPMYYQIRYLDPGGKEILRVNQIKGHVEIVPVEQLQNKRDRYYVNEMRNLPAHGLYLSPLDLNVEHGQVEVPFRPTIRYGLAVEEEGTRRGFLLINLHGSDFLAHLRDMQIPEGGQVLLLQQEGTLIAQRTTEEYTEHWSNGDRIALEGRLSQETVAALLSGQTGTVYDSSNGQMVAYVPLKMPAFPVNRYWVLAMTVPRGSILAPLWTMAKISGGLLVLFLVFVAVVGIAAAHRLSRPVRELTEASMILASGAYDIALDVQTNDELEDLARDFQEMARVLKARDDVIRQHQEQLEETIRIRTREIAQEKDKLNSVIRGIGAGLALLDRDLRIVWHNDRLSQWFGDSLLGKPCYRLFGCTESDRSACKALEVLNEGAFRAQDLTVTLPDGRVIICMNSATPIRDDAGSITHVLYLSQDITEQRMLEQKERLLREQLERAEKLATLGEFSAGIAHEVGNPLAAMKTTIQAVQEEIPPDHDHHAMLERVVGEINRLNQVVRTFLAFARPKEVRREPVDLRLIVREVIQLMSAEAQNSRVRFAESYEEGLPAVLVDARQIQQVLLNLVLNAIQAMPEGGDLRVEGRWVGEGARAGFVELALADTGMGISPDDLPRIFNPFFSTKPRGTGLGLSVAYNLVKHNGGEIAVRSRPGRGTVFTVTFPAADAPVVTAGGDRRERHAAPHPGD